MNTNPLFSVVLKNGLFLGVTLCFYTLFMWLTKLDTEYLSIGQYLDMAVVAVPVYFIFTAIRQAMNLSPIGIGERILIALGVGLIAQLIYAPFLYTYHNFINPSWFDSVIALEKAKFLAQSLSEQVIQVKIKEMIERNEAQNTIFSLGAFIASVIVLPLLITGVSFIFIRRPKLA